MIRLGGQPIKANIQTSKHMGTHMSSEGLSILSSLLTSWYFLHMFSYFCSCPICFYSSFLCVPIIFSIFSYYPCLLLLFAYIFSYGSIRNLLFLYYIYNSHISVFIFRGLRPHFLLTGNLMLVGDLRYFLKTLFSPHLCVWFLFLVLHSRLLLPSSRRLPPPQHTHNFLTHNLSTHNLSTLTHTHNLSTQNLSTHTLLTHTHNLSTHNLFHTYSHTTCPHRTCSHTTCHER